MDLVFFDFDKTLTTVDTTLPLASFLAAGRRKRMRYVLFLGIYFFSRARLISNQGLKQWFALLFLSGQSVDEITAAAREFFHKYLHFIRNADVLDRLRHHASRGSSIYLLSANFSFFLRPLQDIWPVTGIVATRTEIQNGMYTGRLLGRSCHGREKLERVVRAFGREAVSNAIAYSDDTSDMSLLECIREGYLVEHIRRPGRLPGLRAKALLFFRGYRCLSGRHSCQLTTKILPVGRRK